MKYSRKTKVLATVLFVATAAGSAVIGMANTLGLGGGGNFALQSEATETLIEADEVESKKVSVRYINNDGEVDARPVILYLPKNRPSKIPLVYVPHYAIDEGSLEWQTYLARGWGVASPSDFSGDYNGSLVDDDLVFNNAALHAMRTLDEVDTQRIAIVGGSAGGYTALMLNGLQMGTVATVANSPVSNIYFNFHEHFPAASDVNRNWKFWDLPIPFIALQSKAFEPILDNFSNAEAPERWEALSPVGMAKAFSSPIVINHFTGDMLVPVDQVSKEFTYADHDDTLPESFTTRMSQGYPGILSESLQEQLPPDQTSVVRLELQDVSPEAALMYRDDARFNINIIDDGPVSAKNSHFSSSDGAPPSILTGDYIEKMFAQGLARTEALNGDKLAVLLDRFQGKSPQLPAHVGVDDSIYGSLAIYQSEIVEQLSTWVSSHSIEELESAMRSVIDSAADRDSAENAWEDLKARL